MNRLSIIFIIVICSFACSSRNDKIIRDESTFIDETILTIKVPYGYDNLLQIDSIFEAMQIIPLETNKQCILSSIGKVLSRDSCIYIQNQNTNLFVFSTTGKFIREISHRGKGPGEFLSVRDFDIDKAGNIYILDFLKIQKYSSQGKLIDKYTFNFSPQNTIQCNPLQFALCGEDNFYIWGGSIGIKNNKNKNLFLMYKMNKKGEITERYFPLKQKVQHNRNQFSKFSDYYNVVPLYGNNFIYKVSDKGVSRKYYIDFGKRTMTTEVPEDYLSLSDFKAEMDQEYANSIENIVETKDWFYFTFNYKGYIKNAYYSKVLDKTFVSKPYPRVPNRIMPWIIHSKEENDLISLIEPRIILEDLKNIENTNNEIKAIKDALRNCTINDNYVMIRCKMKKY